MPVSGTESAERESPVVMGGGEHRAAHHHEHEGSGVDTEGGGGGQVHVSTFLNFEGFHH